MARWQYFVVLHKGEWKVKLVDKHYGPYGTQRNAIDAAMSAAHASARQGIDSQVSVQSQENKFRAEWTYGEDAFPRGD